MLHDACILAVFWYFQESLQMSLSLMPPNALVGLITFGKMVSDKAKHPPITGISVMQTIHLITGIIIHYQHLKFSHLLNINYMDTWLCPSIRY